MELEISLKDLFEWLRRGMFFIIAISLACGIGTYAYSRYLEEPQYELSVKFASSSSDETSDRINTYIAIAPQHIEYLNVPKFYQMISEKVFSKSQTLYSESDISSSIRFSQVIENTSAFFVSVKTTDPKKTYDIAVAVSQCAPVMVKNAKPNDYLAVISVPEAAPTVPVSPNISKNTLLGFFVGFVISCAIVVLKEILDKRLKSTDEITEIYKLPVLGTVPDFSGSDEIGGNK